MHMHQYFQNSIIEAGCTHLIMEYMGEKGDSELNQIFFCFLEKVPHSL